MFDFLCRFASGDYRERLYREILRRKREAKEARDKRQREAGAGGGGVGATASAVTGGASYVASGGAGNR